MGVSRLKGGTVRSRLLLVVLAALVPITLLNVWQSQASYRQASYLAADRLRSNAWAIAETEREPFIIARHSLITIGGAPSVRAIEPNCSDVLRLAHQGADGVINFLRTDARGKVACSVLPFVPGTDLAREPWWIRTRQNSGLVISSPQFGPVSQRPVLILAQALHTPEGQFDGTISASISLERLAHSLERKRSELPGAIVVSNRRGIPILQTPAATFRALPDVGMGRTQLRETTAADGLKWKFATAPLFADHLFVVYAEPSRSVMRMQLAGMRMSFLLQFLALVATSIAIWFGSQRLILRWLNRLQLLAANFTRGKLDHERGDYTNAPAEIAQLAGQLHEMADAIQVRDSELRGALAVETALTREVHHRVNNNLQIVSSLLSLQGQRVTDPLAREMIGLARTRIGALGLIHRLLYQEKRFAEQGAVSLRKLFGDLCAHLRTANRDRSQIDLHCSAPEENVSVDQAVPLTLFVVEAVTNAFLHAFEPGEAGIIEIELVADHGQARVSVRDDGKGMDKHNGEQGGGFELMHAFAGQLGGTIEVGDDMRGTRISLQFPIASREH